MTDPITLKDLRASERRIARAVAHAAKRAQAVTDALAALAAEKDRHAALVDLYRQQTVAR